MTNDSSQYHNNMLMSSEWPSFLANLAQNWRGQPVVIEQNGDLLLQHSPDQGMPLQNIELDTGHKQQRLVITTAAQTYTIESPNLIWAVRNEQDALVAVEILDAQERRFVMRFVSGE
jgi:hypothetical protein